MSGMPDRGKRGREPAAIARAAAARSLNGCAIDRPATNARPDPTSSATSAAPSIARRAFRTMSSTCAMLADTRTAPSTVGIATCISIGEIASARRTSRPAPPDSAACTSGNAASSTVDTLARAVSPDATMSPVRLKSTMRWELRRSRPRRTSVGLPDAVTAASTSRASSWQAALEFILEIALQRPPRGPDEDGDGKEEDDNGSSDEPSGELHLVLLTLSVPLKR